GARRGSPAAAAPVSRCRCVRRDSRRPSEELAHGSPQDRVLLVARELTALQDEVERLRVRVFPGVVTERVLVRGAGQSDAPVEATDVARPHESIGAERVDDLPELWNDIRERIRLT